MLYTSLDSHSNESDHIDLSRRGETRGKSSAKRVGPRVLRLEFLADQHLPCKRVLVSDLYVTFSSSHKHTRDLPSCQDCTRSCRFLPARSCTSRLPDLLCDVPRAAGRLLEGATHTPNPRHPYDLKGTPDSFAPFSCPATKSLAPSRPVSIPLSRKVGEHALTLFCFSLVFAWNTAGYVMLLKLISTPATISDTSQRASDDASDELPQLYTIESRPEHADRVSR